MFTNTKTRTRLCLRTPAIKPEVLSGMRNGVISPVRYKTNGALHLRLDLSQLRMLHAFVYMKVIIIELGCSGQDQKVDAYS
jgi:hypothetical protein